MCKGAPSHINVKGEAQGYKAWIKALFYHHHVTGKGTTTPVSHRLFIKLLTQPFMRHKNLAIL